MRSAPATFELVLFPFDRWGGVEPIAHAAQAAEALGFDAVGISDHVIMPVRRDIAPVSVVWYDPFVLAAYLAARTERIGFTFSVLVLPYRPPIQTAKLISTLDTVSGGRLTVGVGTGHLRSEFRNLGIDRTRRGDLTDEYLDAMIELWTADNPQFSGPTVSFGSLAFQPRCVQRPHVPLWIGGSGPRALQRVLRVGQGWAPMVGTDEELRQSIAWLRGHAAGYGRNPDEFTLSYGINFGPQDPDQEQALGHATREGGHLPGWIDTPEQIIGRISDLRALGFSRFRFAFAWTDPDDFIRRLQWFSSQIMPEFRSAGR